MATSLVFKRPKVERKAISRSRSSAASESPIPPVPLIGGDLRGDTGLTGHSTKLNQLLDLAATLSEGDRKQLLDRLALDQQVSKERALADSRDLDMWVRSVGTALQAALGGGSGTSYPPLLLRRTIGSLQNWSHVEQFMQASGFVDLPVIKRQVAYVMLAELLVKHAAEMATFAGAPLGPKFVGNCTNMLAALFDRAFPGYLRAGLALAVIDHLRT